MTSNLYLIKCYYLRHASLLDCFLSTMARICSANSTRLGNSSYTLSSISFIVKPSRQWGGGQTSDSVESSVKKFFSVFPYTNSSFIRQISFILSFHKTKQTRRQVELTIITGSVAHRVVIGHVAELRRSPHVWQVRFPVGPFLCPELAVDECAQRICRLRIRPVQQRSVDETRDADLLTKQPPDISRGYRP